MIQKSRSLKQMENNIKIQYLGYDVKITYDDYDTHDVLVQDLNELETICKNLENCDDTFNIKYKKKYQLEDGSFFV